MNLAAEREALINKKVRIYLLKPEGFKLDGKILESTVKVS